MTKMKITILLFLALTLFSCNSKGQQKEESKYPVVKTEAEWQQQLTAIEYYVLRKAGTEKAFSSELDKNFEPGLYACKACEIPLYRSMNKFDSGTGWPSFDSGIDENLEYGEDKILGYTRTEILCANCGSHLGHLFDDGPKETSGKRHCINGVALKFIPK